ncbi:alpha/beta hydrolase family protein [Paludibacterium paludis]|uniref:Dienelactone hydrolase n=1 Tax=Paludibacterium paludis TaxID=1225769 RepID=A0A918U9P4_9NEIS|nr:alpha/beta hydrolase [Paludibacterium paludis]GGY13011.1 hypothetical protein GCM10011289_15240 [Paludibacterium paludis]
MGYHAGYLCASVRDTFFGCDFPLQVFYPTDTEESETRLGPYRLPLARDGALSLGRFPLALISHGSGGAPLTHRDLARYLARHGWVVGLPEHPRNNRNDNSGNGTLDNLAARPLHLAAAIDWFERDGRFARSVATRATAVIGHSMGGYAALALAGGKPRSLREESGDGLEREVEVAKDARIAALVLLAPATVWFREKGALDGVDQPILMLCAERDEWTPAEHHAHRVLSGTGKAGTVDYRIVRGAGHFSFLSPFPAEMTHPGFPPSQDPAGFDRLAYHYEMRAEILAFLSAGMPPQD